MVLNGGLLGSNSRSVESAVFRSREEKFMSKYYKNRILAPGWMLLGLIALAGIACNKAAGNSESANGESKAPAKSGGPSGDKIADFRFSGVRYQVKNVDRSIEFYTRRLGFKLDQQAGTAFAAVSKGNLRLLLSGPGSSGSRPMPDGRTQEPGGWNRILLEVDDLESVAAALKTEGAHFRNEIEKGPGGSQIQIEDPDGNTVELFQPAH
jgi:glyoxylase I family protein